jgi:molybdopterin-guanine dinucleotide biosynthesis protein MobB
MSNILGIAGYSGSGKTTLLSNIIPELKKKGYVIGVIKHAHRMVDIGNSDSDKFYDAGADQVIASAPDTVIKISRQSRERRLEELINEISFSSDIVFVEGYKEAKIPKILVLKKGKKGSHSMITDEHTVAIVVDSMELLRDIQMGYSDFELANEGGTYLLMIKKKKIPVFIFDDTQKIVSFVCGYLNPV